MGTSHAGRAAVYLCAAAIVWPHVLLWLQPFCYSDKVQLVVAGATCTTPLCPAAVHILLLLPGCHAPPAAAAALLLHVGDVAPSWWHVATLSYGERSGHLQTTEGQAKQ